MKPPVLTLEGAAFICAFEGFLPRCYDDGGRMGVGNCTIGYGHLVHMGPTTPADEHRWGMITRQQGQRLFVHDAQPVLFAIERRIHVPLTPAQVAALCSFAYNCGAGALLGNVGHTVNAKPRRWQRHAIRVWHDDVRAALLQWDHAGGQVLAGLERRREAEAVLFATGAYDRAHGNHYANA